jgi:hypothetical protein
MEHVAYTVDAINSHTTRLKSHRGRNSLEKRGTDGRIILKWVLKE